MSTLSIYKASAGSGKTYQLTWIYLEMLFTDPTSYRQILAVTFTNKAAAEMKFRILDSLWLLSKGDNKVSGYQEDIRKKFGLSNEGIKRKAVDILNRILNDYSSFFVGTIDRFFQWVIRGFVREIGLQTGYNLELNNDRILHEAVDRIMVKMDEDAVLRQWLITFAGERIMEGKSWNFQNDVFNLGKEVFREGYQSLSLDISILENLRGTMANYKTDLNHFISQYENTLKKLGHEALGQIRDAGLQVEDFSYGRNGAAGYFLKVLTNTGMNLDPGKRACEAAENAELWVTRTGKNREKALFLAESQLQSALKKIIGYQSENARKYFSARCLIKNIHSFGILNDISLEIREITREKNIFLLSDASMFLKKIIEENEAPFIYEKAGNYFHRFMLDEFQDTSRFQWINFLPLIKNGLGLGNKSMVVGDVKQSIYRWRNSDWKILAKEIENDITGFITENHSLGQNWRSYPSIVKFNNSFFYQAKTLVQEMIRTDMEGVHTAESFSAQWQTLVEKVYSESAQQIPEKLRSMEGLVEHTFSRTESEENYTNFLKVKLPALIRDMQGRGFRARDIAILVRRGSEGRAIASILLEEGLIKDDGSNFSLISNDSLYLGNNPAVSFIVSILTYLNNPADKLNAGFMRSEFFHYLTSEVPDNEALHAIYANNATEDSGQNKFDLFTADKERFRKLPLYELTESVIVAFGLNETKDNLPFIQAFQDIVLEFIRTESNELYGFLNYWEQNGASKTLNISETQDAIRIMTIHKAKGLQFETVIIPYCSWPISPDTPGYKNNFIWCDTNSSDFNRTPFMPVSYNREMSRSEFAREYFSEKFHSYIDNLNLMYVAFTRARQELHIFSPVSGKEKKVQKAGDLALTLYTKYGKHSSPEPGIRLAQGYFPEKEKFILGKPEQQKEHREREDNYYLESYPVRFSGDILKLNLRNAALSKLEEDLGTRLGYGTIMHEIFSYISYPEDVEAAIGKVKRKGMIDETEARRLEDFIGSRLRGEGVSDWYTDQYTLLMERELISKKKEILRPDRVMISEDEIIVLDYKFGERMIHNHEIQVRNYCSSLGDIESRKVKGYLWYVDLDIVKKV